jgi:tetratricopeptide (TPR) repeat protein
MKHKPFRVGVLLASLCLSGVVAAQADFEVQARAAMANQNYNQAIALYSRLVFGAPDNTVYLTELAKAYQIQGDAVEAHATLDRLLALTPDAAQPLLLKGGLLVSQQRWQEAATLFERYVALHPQEKAGYHNLSVIYQALGDKPRADAMEKKYFELP